MHILDTFSVDAFGKIVDYFWKSLKFRIFLKILFNWKQISLRLVMLDGAIFREHWEWFSHYQSWIPNLVDISEQQSSPFPLNQSLSFFLIYITIQLLTQL